MSNLRDQLDALAKTFADGILAAIRRASLDELLVEGGGERRPPAPATDSKSPKPRGAKGRLPRRSLEQVQATLAEVVAALKATKGKGLRSEQIQSALGLDKRELPRVIAEGFKTKKLASKGRKRATTYFAG